MTIANYSEFKFENHPSIMEASRIIIEEGCQPKRIVLRMNRGVGLHGAEYVTHMESVVLDGDTWKHGSFYWGHYFQNDKDGALNDYSERVKKL